jgi:hypothetical protein
MDVEALLEVVSQREVQEGPAIRRPPSRRSVDLRGYPQPVLLPQLEQV